jgi:transcriptional antiterminator RfaH
MKIDSIFNWYVLYTYPNSEKKVETNLSLKKIETYLPLQKVRRQWSDRKKTVLVPLFPNYVFVYANHCERYKILEVPGALRFVSFGGRPVFISVSEIDTIKKLLSNDHTLAVEKSLEKGDAVRITDGSFAGLCGILFERKGQKRFGIQINSINQSLSIEISSSCLEKIVE